jgi:hypothetical protein
MEKIRNKYIPDIVLEMYLPTIVCPSETEIKIHGCSTSNRINLSQEQKH